MNTKACQFLDQESTPTEERTAPTKSRKEMFMLIQKRDIIIVANLPISRLYTKRLNQLTCSIASPTNP